MSIYSKAIELMEATKSGEQEEVKKRNVFFTSDQHFFHKNIIPYCSRPFHYVDEMNEHLIFKYNEKVGNEDTVYHLGDFSMSFSSVEKTLARLNGKKILIMGNHDACSHLFRYKGKVPIRDYVKAGFSEVYETLELNLDFGGYLTPTVLHHFPYEPDANERADRRYINARPLDTGKLLLHGHIHTSWLTVPNKRMFNVGVDRSHEYAPWSLDDITKVLLSEGMIERSEQPQKLKD